MPTLDPEIKSALEKYGLGQDAVWLHKQSGKYIMYHWACEHIAIKAGIEWDRPSVITAEPKDKIAVVCVFGKLGERTEWSFGEAAPYNTQQTYPFSMAEKRAKDRVILKLMGIHGKVYSEEESDDFKGGNTNTPTNGAVKVEQSKVSKSNWTGPLNKSNLDKSLRNLATSLRKSYDAGNTDAFMETYSSDNAKLVMEQAARDMPVEWAGPHSEGGEPYRDYFERMRGQLTAAARVLAVG